MTYESTIRLGDGRDLSVAESGDPAGVPVVFCHGTPGSRRIMPADAGLADRLGIRLITVDRPGYGGSTRQRGRVVHSWSHDLDEVADHLGLASFGLAAWSGGAAFALAAAEVHAPRVCGVAVVSPLGPFDAYDAPDDLPGHRARQVRLLRSRHVGTSAASAISGIVLRRTAKERATDPAGAVTSLLAGTASVDRPVLERPQVRAQLVDDLALSLRQGVAGWADDLGALVKPWAVDFRAVRAPLTIWHGTADREVAPAAARRLADAVPGAVLHLVEGAGHHVLHDLWTDVLLAATGRR